MSQQKSQSQKKPKMAEIQRTIDDRYSHKYNTRTPTAKPPAAKTTKG
jgi:hypothetical protein